MFRNLVLCLCCLFLAACAGREQSSAPPPADFVSTTLGHALQPLLLPSDPSLNLPVSITWTGPVEGALKEICLQLGFRYREAGTPSAQVMTVVVHGLNRPAHELLEDIAWQIQPQAAVRFDPINRVLTLARTTGKELHS